MNPNIFREYDIRGTYPETINETIAYTIGRSYGSYLIEKLNQTTCIVSHDNRLSSPALAAYLIKGITDSGLNVFNYGLTTTPMHYYARYVHNLFGIMITASHNPKDDNGFKFSFDNLANARGSMIEDFKNYTLEGKFLNGNGTISNGNITEKYVEYLRYGVELGRHKRKVIVDLGNGATTIVARRIFEKLNLDFEIIFEESDGRFPNHHPDPIIEENLIALKNEVLKNKADIGIAFDGDGDRCLMVDENGEVVSGVNYWVSDFDDTYVYVEKYTWGNGDSDTEHGRFAYSFDDANIVATINGDFEKMIVTWVTVEENERLNAERTEYERLVNFEKDILATNRKNEVKAVFDKFDERLADVEGYSDLKANYGDMSIEDIEDKCFAMVGKITTKFSAKKKNDSVVKLDFEVSEPDTKDDGYGGILSSRYSN